MDPGGSNDFLCQGSSRLLLVVRGYLRGSQGGGPVTCSLPVSNAQIFAALRIRRADACGKASLPRMQPTALLRSSALTTASVARSSIRKFIEHLRRPHDGAGFETQNTDSQKRTMTAGNRLVSACRDLRGPRPMNQEVWPARAGESEVTVWRPALFTERRKP